MPKVRIGVEEVGNGPGPHMQERLPPLHKVRGFFLLKGIV